MKAMVYTRYGSPDVLQLTEVARPVPGDDDVLVQVHASSINSWDWDLVTGKPLVYRLLFGVRKPKHPIIGCDIAGRVAAVGSNVTQWQPGDAVFGDVTGCGFGGFAEYIAVPAQILARKPASMSFEEAAAIPQAAVLALQGLRQGQIQQGQKVLINGAGGGVGTFAVQLAKYYGADVTGVDSAAKLDMLRSLGADQVIDYRQEDVTRSGQQYDLILDVVASRSVFAYQRVLRPTGNVVLVGGKISTILQVVHLGTLVSWRSNQNMGLLLHKPDANDLEVLIELFVSGNVVPIIDRRYPLRETAEALRYLGEGHVKGKVVITMEQMEQQGDSR